MSQARDQRACSTFGEQQGAVWLEQERGKQEALGGEPQAFWAVIKTCLQILREGGNRGSSQLLGNLGLKEKIRFWLADFVDSRHWCSISEHRSGRDV